MPMNMSYCQFENTYAALRECDETLSEKDISELSESERKYAIRLFKLCSDIASEYTE